MVPTVMVGGMTSVFSLIELTMPELTLLKSVALAPPIPSTPMNNAAKIKLLTAHQYGEMLMATAVATMKP